MNDARELHLSEKIVSKFGSEYRMQKSPVWDPIYDPVVPLRNLRGYPLADSNGIE